MLHDNKAASAKATKALKALAPDEIPPRAEHKFLLTARQTEQVRACVAMHCSLDSNSAREPNHRYLITSLYLDTDNFAFFRAKELGAHERFKLRIRRYGLTGGPVWLEVKHRVGDTIRKSRVTVPVDSWQERILVGHPNANPLEQDFRARMIMHGARPSLLVRYEREAWKGDVERYVRVTFDARLQHHRADSYDLDGNGDFDPDDSPTCFDSYDSLMLLEVKFERDIPRWLTSMVRDLELQRVGFSKYGTGVKRAYDMYERLDATNRIAGGT
jgi:SPX domain protein involved in polyphosphate accumulation